MFFERGFGTKWNAAGVLVILCGAVGSLGCGPSQSAVPPPDSAPTGWMMTTELVGLDLTTVWAAGRDIFAAGRGAKIAHSADGGLTWSMAETSAPASGAPPAYRHFSGSAAGDVWIAGSAGDESLLLHSADYGASWQRRDIVDVQRLTAIWAIDADQLLIGTGDGDLLRSQDGGGTWSAVARNAGATIDALWGSTTGYMYAVGGRASSVPADPAGVSATTGCDGGSADDLADGGSDMSGLLLRSTDNGIHWDAIGVAPAGELRNVSGIGVGSLIVASGAHESVVTSADGGLTWTVDARPLSPLDFLDVWVDPRGAAFFATATGVVIHLEYSCKGPVGIETENLPAGSSGATGAVGLWGTANGQLWAVGPDGIIRSRR